MKAKQMMDKDFIYASKDDSVVDISIRMEEQKKFTVPILDDSMKLVGWITSLEVTKGLREGKKTISEIMHPVEDILTINENKPAKNAVILTANHKLVSIPVVDDDNKVIGVCRAFDIVDTLSDLYDIKVEKLYEAMEEELENNIKNSTFGEAIWATGGLEKFFAGLISVGEIVIARKVGRAKRGAK